MASPDELARQFGMAILEDLADASAPDSIIAKVPYAYAKRNLAVPVTFQGALAVAVADPLRADIVEEMGHLLGVSVAAVYTPKEALLKQLHRCYERDQAQTSQMLTSLGERSEGANIEGEPQVYDLLDEGTGQVPAVKMLNLILLEAIQQGASDIHFEPYEEELVVRYRIDGVLQVRHRPPTELQNRILTRIKVMASLDIAERRLPQDGRIKLRVGHRDIDFRVSTVPVVGGERVVLRILDKGNVLLGFDALGLLPGAAKQFKRLLARPEGMILVTGPTGSGKTTTLYSAVAQLQSDETNIMTVEDPVEYKLRGVAQIGVRPKIGLTFATGLRHILRQDPDVVMIGEIRDAETAEIAVQAALTGHLVFSTLHTNDAPSAVTRLVDMGIEPYLLSSSLIGVLAQRLVRTICSHCAESYTPSESECASLGLTEEEQSRATFRMGRGCGHCYGSGYRGRCGIYELMLVDPPIIKNILHSADAIAMRQTALQQGMLSLRHHGTVLVREGVTTIAEVLRVTRGVTEEEGYGTL